MRRAVVMASRQGRLLTVMLAMAIHGGWTAAAAPQVPPLPANPAPIPDMTRSMIEVRAAQVEADRFLPWRNSVPRWQSGYAVAVEPGIFLVPEPLIRNHAAMQVRPAGSILPIPAEVIVADPRVGLALIRASAQDALADTIPLPRALSIPSEEPFVIVQWGDNDHLQTDTGNLLSIGHQSIGQGIPPQLTYDLASSMRASEPGTPILHEGRLAGLAMRFEGRRGSATILAPESIERFLTAATNLTYRGVPEPDFESIPLADPVRRAFLGVPAAYGNRGVYISRVQQPPDTPHGLLPQDVLLQWDGYDLDARGNYEHPAYGRIPFQHLMAQRSAGEQVAATIVRDQTVQEVRVTLRAHDDVLAPIPENTIGEPDDYVVAAGLVFRELTRDFLEAHGSRWQRRADINLTWHAYGNVTNAPSAAPQRTVILVGVLADPINIGYRDLHSRRVLQINGQTIANLADLAARLDAQGLQSVTLAQMEDVPLVFDPAEVAVADQRIQQRFQIPRLQRLPEQPR